MLWCASGVEVGCNRTVHVLLMLYYNNLSLLVRIWIVLLIHIIFQFGNFSGIQREQSSYKQISCMFFIMISYKTPMNNMYQETE